MMGSSGLVGKFSVFLMCLLVFITSPAAAAFGDNPDRVLLHDVSAITLHQGRMTTSRRSSPVSQLQCVGGTAKGYFTPSVVQCINRGSDGYDIQWECKADMDNKYKFGTVEVTCEGYDYPNDPYVLRGSCGLEYTLDLTEEGYQKNRQQDHRHSQSYSPGDYYDHGYGKRAKSVFGDLLFLGGVALVIYIIYKTCLSSSATAREDDSHYPHADRGSSQPPPYGFRPEYRPGDDSCSSARGATYSTGYTGAGANTGGGFWTGAATGGLLGYLFGRNGGYNTYTEHQPYRPQGWGTGYRSRPYYGGGWGSGSSWFGGGGGTATTFSSGSSGSSSGGSGSRTASGFGGTKRR